MFAVLAVPASSSLLRPFTIMFFLADDTLEISEQYPLNCGREKFPIFFRRGKMPLGPYKVEGPQAQARKKSESLGASWTPIFPRKWMFLFWNIISIFWTNTSLNHATIGNEANKIGLKTDLLSQRSASEVCPWP